MQCTGTRLTNEGFQSLYRPTFFNFVFSNWSVAERNTAARQHERQYCTFYIQRLSKGDLIYCIVTEIEDIWRVR